MQQIKLYTLTDAATRLGISRMTLYRHIKEGLLPPPAVLKRLRVYTEEQLDDYQTQKGRGK